MLAKLCRKMPESDGLLYEPKWDGFRCIVFRDGREVELGSRNEKPLTRYFPELVESLLVNLPERCVLDGEVVIVGGSGLDFDALLQRIHPAASRVKLLASATPASYVAFDLLAFGHDDLRREPFTSRRSALEQALGHAKPPIYLTPATPDPAVARDWFARFEGAGLDGVVAKPGELTYREGERVMLKVKHERTADCVVGGFRWHKDGGGVGSLLLGLYDDQGALHHVGVASGLAATLRSSLVDDLTAYRLGSSDGHPWRATTAGTDNTRRPGAPSRWNANSDLSWEAVAPELVCEVGYDHLQGDRFRHATSFRRWRRDREPGSCTYAQLEVVAPEELARVFGAGN
jgi:ATP-dependent DNA ligase